MYDAVDDPYTYDRSTVLKNKLDLRSQKKLDAFEAEISTQRAAEPLPKGSLDFAHYCKIHRHLFQDVYTWAGKVRTVRISKDNNPFCFPEHIDVQATKLFADLKAKSFLKDLSAKDFSKKAAHFLSELNVVHAFREGNGRTQLSFLSLLGDQAGHTLDLTKLKPKAMLTAVIASFDGDESLLQKLIGELIAD